MTAPAEKCPQISDGFALSSDSAPSTGAAEHLLRECRVVCPQSEQDRWLAERRTRITGTDAAVLHVGRLYGRTPLSLWAEKTGRMAGERQSTDAMKLGLLLESYVREQICAAAGVRGMPYPYLLARLDTPWMACTLDGAGFTADDEPCTIEVKTGGSHLDEANQLSPALTAQVQWGLAVTGLKRCLVGVMQYGYFGPQEPVYTWVQRDDALIHELKGKAAALRGRLISDIPPEPGPAEEDAEALGRIYARGDLSATAIEGEWIERLDELEQIKAEAKALSERKSAIENALKARMGNHTLGQLPDGSRVTWSAPIERKSYTVEATTYRRFSVTRRK